MTADPTDATHADTRSRERRISAQRRAVLTSAGVGLATALAGCLGNGGGSAAGNGTTGTTTATGPDDPGSDSATAAGSNGASDDLDLREANVVGVAIEGSEGRYTFDVTLHHDDDGEQGYANWWQVETLGGEQLGRRELLHAHGSKPFTRSAAIEVPENVSQVVVRGHDEVHGYGGQAMVVTLSDGATRAVGQGSDPQEFGNESES